MINKIWEIIKVAFAALKANKLRSALTMVGIIVGIFSIVAVSTLITMLQTSIEEGVSALGKNTFQLQKWPSLQMSNADMRKLIRNRRDITLEEFEKFDEIIGNKAKHVGAEMWNGGKLLKYRSEETNPNVNVTGTTTGAFPNNNWNVAEGREYNDRDIQSYAKVIVLGIDVSNALFGNTPISPIGQEIWMDGHKFRVIGILESQGSFFGNSQDNFAMIPITTFQAIYGKEFRSVNITVMAHSKEEYDELIQTSEGIFRTVRQVPATEPNDFDVRTNEAILNQINSFTEPAKIGAYAIAAIALIAAGVGIMNIMLVSVTERTKEIGIRKAIGAKNNNIMLQFITEAVALSLLGGFIGIIIGVITGNMIGNLLNAVAVIPFGMVAVGFTLCVMIGIIFGTYPAFKASRLDPIEALRYE